MSAAPAFLRRDARHVCEGCGRNAVGVLLVRRLSTGETMEITTCDGCRVTSERTLWRRYSPVARA